MNHLVDAENYNLCAPHLNQAHNYIVEETIKGLFDIDHQEQHEVQITQSE